MVVKLNTAFVVGSTVARIQRLVGLVPKVTTRVKLGTPDHGWSILNVWGSPWTGRTGFPKAVARLLSVETSDASEEPSKGSSCQMIMTPGLRAASAWSKAALSQATLALWRAAVSDALGLLPFGPGTLRVANT